MGCNAWNHSLNCTCGWGGDGHLGRRTQFTNLVNSKITFRTYGDLLYGFTNPNAKCPVCGSPVYFYASPYGGRVFFDELGPPWPKHPCTDHGRPVLLLPSKTSLPALSLEDFKNKEWRPFLCQDISPAKGDPKISVLTGLINDQKKTLFVIIEGLSDGAPFLIKFNEDGEIWLSTVLSTKNEIKADTFRAFEFESNLRTLLPESVEPKIKRFNKAGRSAVAILSTKKVKNSTRLAKNPELFQCPDCSSFVRNLKKHIANAHTNQKLTVCAVCGQSVKNLNSHYEKNHSESALTLIKKKNERTMKRRLEKKALKNLNDEISKRAKTGICPLCDFKSKSEMALIAHLTSAHQTDPTVLLKKR